MKRTRNILSLALAVIIALSTGAFALAAETPFTDVPADAWYAEAVAYSYDTGLMVGTSDTAFSPDIELSRAMVVTILHRAAGTPAVTGTASFSDVESGAWYSSAVAWSEQNEIVAGYGTGLFGTNDPVTREQLITLLWRYNGSKTATTAPAFSDASDVSSWAAGSVAWAGENNIANVKNGNRLDPRGNASRAETAYMFKQLLAPSDTDTVYTPDFNYETGTVTLNNGIKMPVVGIGTFTLTDEQAADSVYSALTSGYKLIDTAYAYNNEKGVGEGIKRSGAAREDVFITTKLWPSDYDNAAQAIDDALERLGVEYIDLLLLHQAWGNYVGAYQAMEVALSEGKVRAIGVSNFYTQAFDEIMAVAKVTPAVLQNERNPYFQQGEMQKHIAPYGTVLMDWFPLGGRSERQTSLFENEIILEIAEAHDVTAAQVILRWHIQSGGIAIPGSTNPDHIKENIAIFGFELTDKEMEKMATLETGIPAFDFSTPNTMPGFTPPQDSDS